MLFEIIGPDEVFQQTPRAVTAAPPLEVILPPLVAPLAVKFEIAVVLSVDKPVVVVADT